MPRDRTQFSLPIWRRQLAADILDLLPLVADTILEGLPRVSLKPRGEDAFPTAWRRAADRLARAGLIALRRSDGKTPLLRLTAAGESRVSDWLWPERFWNRRWSKRWYVLVYDVPETCRSYRIALQRFLRRTRMGCLQRSVWVAAHDIRPLIHDLHQAAALEDVAVLFEAYTVFGKSGSELAAQAWDFDRLETIHLRYLQPTAPLQPPHTWRMTLDTMRAELRRYTHAMADDPLLPATLYPASYQGPAVAAAFRKRLRDLARILLHRPGHTN